MVGVTVGSGEEAVGVIVGVMRTAIGTVGVTFIPGDIGPMVAGPLSVGVSLIR
jgi:hypothetical protein